MTRPALYPLQFEPIFMSMLWGGRRLPGLLNRPHPSGDPVGEAWVVSDVDKNPSRVANGPLAGTTLRDLLAADHTRILGPAKPVNGRFPLLLKFIDARQELSVQVHPDDEQAARKHFTGSGKTEAWVVLEADPATSRIYAGFRPGVTAADFEAALAGKTAPHTLHSFVPRPGDCVFLEAGTVHAIGANVLLFEVQQTSDITYRLYDWDRVDAKTGAPRELHVADGLACADFARGPCHPVRPAVEERDGVRREGLVSCNYFTLERYVGSVPFRVGVEGRCRIVVCVDGRGELESRGAHYPIGPGAVVLLPAEVGECVCRPTGEITLLECGLPE
ncbi:MAG: gmuF [Gemmataceae bacterium]|nr:gmuF [Gemmataceae bacterium]